MLSKNKFIKFQDLLKNQMKLMRESTKISKNSKPIIVASFLNYFKKKKDAANNAYVR